MVQRAVDSCGSFYASMHKDVVKEFEEVTYMINVERSGREKFVMEGFEPHGE